MIAAVACALIVGLFIGFLVGAEAEAMVRRSKNETKASQKPDHI